MASVNDYFKKLGGASSIVNSPKVTSTRSGGGITLAVDNCNWDQTTGKVFATYQVDTSNNVVAGTQTIWTGVVNSTTSIGSLTYVAGAADTGNEINDIVELLPASKWANDLMTGLLVEHNQTGNHTDVTATSLTATGTVQGATVVATGDNQIRSVSLETIKSETSFDHVASGCVWSGDSYGSTKAASMTAGVVYIGGKRVSVSAVTARTFTASKDVYVDVDNTGTLTYTDNTTNAASPALAANSIRLGIIVVGASSIAAATSINQGQENRVLPIASSIPYAVTDSLGNLICPRDPQRRVLGYRQVITNLSNTGTADDMTGLNLNCIVPAGRKIRISGFIGAGSASAANNGVSMTLVDVTAGATIAVGKGTTNASADATECNPVALLTPAAGTRNFKAQAGRGTNAATWNSNGSATNPNYIMVELV